MVIAGLSFMVAGFVQISVQNADTSISSGHAKVCMCTSLKFNNLLLTVFLGVGSTLFSGSEHSHASIHNYIRQLIRISIMITQPQCM